jgi:hypothetical protein
MLEASLTARNRLRTDNPVLVAGFSMSVMRSEAAFLPPFLR